MAFITGFSLFVCTLIRCAVSEEFLSMGTNGLEFQWAANEALKAVNQRKVNEPTIGLVRVEGAAKRAGPSTVYGRQVVYDMQVLTGPTQCTNLAGVVLPPGSCQVQSGKPKMVRRMRAVFSPWAKKFDLVGDTEMGPRPENGPEVVNAPEALPYAWPPKWEERYVSRASAPKRAVFGAPAPPSPSPASFDARIARPLMPSFDARIAAKPMATIYDIKTSAPLAAFFDARVPGPLATIYDTKNARPLAAFFDARAPAPLAFTAPPPPPQGVFAKRPVP